MYGIDLSPSQQNLKIEKLLKKRYPNEYARPLENPSERTRIFRRLKEIEWKKELIFCKKNEEEYPVWLCDFCPDKRISAKSITGKCKYQKYYTVLEKIRARRQKEWPKELTQSLNRQ